jgi:hypothetical protein
MKALEITCRNIADPAIDFFQDYADVNPLVPLKKEPTAKKKTPEYIG